MRSVFIRNQKGTITLQTRLKTLIKDADQLKFLVGFFYFSGLRELYEGLKNNSSVVLKILVGMNADILNQKLVEYPREAPQESDKQHLQKYFDELKKSLGDEDFDNEAFYEQIIFFLKMIDEGRLLIRKTREPNHSKIYFVYDEDNPMKQKLFITGSSNLTRPGLTTQAEFNVEISDFGAEETEAYFDDLWEDAIPITEIEEFKVQLKVTIEQGTMIRDITPFEAFALTLKTYLDTFKQEEIGQSLIDTLKSNNYIPYQYQLDAVRQALSIIKDNNGVIIADVVGLGKTIIACSVAKELRKRGIVLCPPGLRGDEYKTSGWRMYLKQFGLNDWDAFSIGKLEDVQEFVTNNNDIEVVIIDEVHRFRNQDTQDYEYLKNICRDKIVILLTATPFNNRPADILSLLKLFITPKKSTITLQNNLVAAFRSYKTVFDNLSYITKNHKSPNPLKKQEAQNRYMALFGEPAIDLTKVKARSKFLANQIREVIQPVTIRRNRLDLLYNPFYKDEVMNLSKLADPIEWFYELTPEQSDFYDQIITEYFGLPEEGGRFTGAIYQPFSYETQKDETNLSEKENFEFIQQRQLSDFMRRLLVHRFESSFGSFQQSIRRFKEITTHALQFIKTTNKYILDRPLLEKIYSWDEESIDQELATFAEMLRSGNYPKNNRVYELDKFTDQEGFLKNIQSDLDLYEEIIQKLDQMDLVEEDPKGNCLVEKIMEELAKDPRPGEPRRKIVIFSEFADTVSHLKLKLEPVLGDRLLVVSGNLSASNIKVINQNFDASYPKQSDDFDVLLTTDRISEGYNLNRAGMIINYDIPWNPVRVIQRVGRINRISKKVFEELYIVNFFPTEKGAQLVQSREIAQNKMFLIHNILGEDAKIFDIDEEPTPSALFQRITANPDELEEVSFYTRMLNKYLQIQAEHPQLVESLASFPPRVKVAKAAESNELLVFFKKGRLYIQSICEDQKEPLQLSFEQALPLIECDFDTPKLPLGENFWSAYGIAKQIKEDSAGAVSQRELETLAKNALQSALRCPNSDIRQYQKFLETLLEDIRDYGTLADFTLRRISYLDVTTPDKQKIALQKIKELESELGWHYLEKEINRLKKTPQEIIIAIENRVP